MIAIRAKCRYAIRHYALLYRTVLYIVQYVLCTIVHCTACTANKFITQKTVRYKNTYELYKNAINAVQYGEQMKYYI